MRRFSLLASFVIFAAVLARHAAGAAAPMDSVQDYSHVIPIAVSGQQGVVQLRLPRDVYIQSRTADLRDVRVFDADGAKVPFAFARPPEQSHTSRATASVRIFPVFDGAEGRTRLPEGLEIRTSRDGSVLSVVTQSTAAVNGAKSAPLSSLILEIRPPVDGGAGASAHAIDALILTLPAGTNNYSVKVALEVSDDLKQWELVAETALHWLVNGETQKLANNRIEFAPTPFRYARLTWIEGTPIEFAGIVAEFPRLSRAAEYTESLLVAPQPGRVNGDLVYPSALAIPVERIAAQFPSSNVVLPALLGQYVELPSRELRRETTFTFRPVVRTTFFQLLQGGKPRASGEVHVPLQHAAHWVLRPEQGAQGKPSLRLTWAPATMYFVASGRPPYLLAVGRDAASVAKVELAQVAPGFTAAELVTVEHAKAGRTRAQQTGAVKPVGDGGMASARSRVAMLWSVLALGVLGLAWMAWQLTAQMRRRPEDAPPA